VSDSASITTPATAATFGIAAEYEYPEQLLEAAAAAREAGYRTMDAYSPHPIEGLDDAIGVRPSRLGWAVLAMGILGAVVGFGLQYYGNALYQPLNIGGRPLNSWPNFIVITFEVTVIFAAFTAGLLMFARNGLPRPYHSIFNTPGFERASRDRYFLCIETADERFDAADTRAFLEATKALAVHEVER
jgi:hypothetical protein